MEAPVSERGTQEVLQAQHDALVHAPEGPHGDACTDDNIIILHLGFADGKKMNF
jgi:hypothetical protein